MLKFLQDLKKKREQKRLLLDFLAEIEKNLESYYVMDQIGRLRFFSLESWEKVKGYEDLTFGQEIRNYVQALSEYNRLLKDFKDYEQWYAADIERKNQENGKLLHAKKEASGQKFKGLDQVIKPALISLREKLIAMKISLPK